MDELGSEDQTHTLGLRCGENFAQSSKSGRVSMTNRDGFSFLTRAPQRQLDLPADRSDLRDVIEERDVAESGSHPETLRRIVRHGRRSGAAVHVEKLVFAQNRHEFGHQRRIGGGLGSLVIVDAHDARNVLKKLLN